MISPNNFNTLVQLGLVGYLLLDQRRSMGRLSRVGVKQSSLTDEIGNYLNSLVAKFAKKQAGKSMMISQMSAKEKEKQKKLRNAGLETAQAQAKYIIFKVACLLGFPLLGSMAYFQLPLYYANLAMVCATGTGLAVPLLWLNGQARRRTEDIQRELPLVLDLTNLGTSAGWDLASSLERVIDALYPEYPNHPLIKELKKARWSAASGYTWEESLERVADKLNNDTVRRTTLALSQAIKQGGDRSKQLESIAQDAQRIYYAELDKRLASLPAKALLVTMMLMCGFFGILMTPVVTGIKNSFGG